MSFFNGLIGLCDSLNAFEGEAMSRPKVDQLIKRVKKKYGEGSIGWANDAKSLTVVRDPFGIFALDLATRGGAPRGKFTLIWGATASGKTGLCLRFIANRQRENPDYVTVYVNTEPGSQNVTDEFMRMVGVNPGNVVMVAPEFGMQGTNAACAMIRTGEIHCVVIDSIASMVPKMEIEGDAEDVFPGAQPRDVNKSMRLMMSALCSYGLDRDDAPTVLLVNQVRQKITRYGDPDTTPGGMGQGFASSLTVKLWRGKDEKDNEHGVTAMRTRFTVQKIRCAPPKGTGEWLTYLQALNGRTVGETNDDEIVFAAAGRYGLIEKTDEGYSLAGREFRIQKGIKDALRADGTLLTDTEQLVWAEAWETDGMPEKAPDDDSAIDCKTP